MTAPKRIQRKRTAGWRIPEGAVYVGRPTKWGNPCDWRRYPTTFRNDDNEPCYIPEAERRRSAVVDFESEVRFGVGRSDRYPSNEEIRRELAGRDLVCWCPTSDPCHADVLLRIANEIPASAGGVE